MAVNPHYRSGTSENDGHEGPLGGSSHVSTRRDRRHRSYSRQPPIMAKILRGFLQLLRTRFSRAATARAGFLRVGQPTGILVA
jgi:hypothetical protein